MMSALEAILQETVTTRDVPFVVAMIGNSKAVVWSGAAGERSSGVSAPEYMRFLRMLLNKGQLDGERILSEAGVELMLANHLGSLQISALETTDPPIVSDLEFFPKYKKSHSLAFMRMEEDIPGLRSAGSQFWAGICNTHFWLDPASDLAGLVLTQSLPFLDTRFMEFYERFERAVYANSILFR